MEKWKAKSDFAEANHLFALKRYSDALELLNRLNREFPGNRRVMMARALCLAEVGRYYEAITACDEILAREKYPRAAHLRKKLRHYLKAEPSPLNRARGTDYGADYLEVKPDEPAPGPIGDERPAHVPPGAGAGNWWMPVAIAVAVMASALGVGGASYYLLSRDRSGNTELAKAELPASETGPGPAGAPVEETTLPEMWVPDYSEYDKYLSPAEQLARQQQAQDVPPPAPFPGAPPGGAVPKRQADPDEREAKESADGDELVPGEERSEAGLRGLGMGLLAALFVGFVVLEFVVLFSTLLLLNKMPRPTLGENLLLIGAVSIGAVLVSQIPYVGKLAATFIIITAFQLTLVDFLVLILVNAVVVIGAIFAVMALVGVSLQALL